MSGTILSVNSTIAVAIVVLDNHPDRAVHLSQVLQCCVHGGHCPLCVSCDLRPMNKMARTTREDNVAKRIN